jgi:hypothetical protein
MPSSHKLVANDSQRENLAMIDEACSEIVAADQEVTVAAVPRRTRVTRNSLDRNPELWSFTAIVSTPHFHLLRRKYIETVVAR